MSDTSEERSSFERRVDEVRPSKTDINFVIMDYLINEGYPDAAEKFRIEANVDQPGDTDTIQERVDIRNYIVKGQIEQAIEKIHDLNPDLLDTNQSLNFALLRLQLIELIKQCTASGSPEDIAPALTFASEQLAPIAPTNPSFLKDLEYTMSLLIFAPESRTPEIKALLEPSLRQQVATRVNEAILDSQGHARRARLKSLVRMRAWVEKEARSHSEIKGLPDSLSIWEEGNRYDGDIEMKGNGTSVESAAS